MIHFRALIPPDGDEGRRPIQLRWSCSDTAHHEHRWRFTARWCGRVQRGLATIIGYVQGRAIVYSLPSTHWKAARNYDGRLIAIVNCPECNARYGLTSHEFSPSGEVSPMIVCPSPACGFKGVVTLEGWKPEA